MKLAEFKNKKILVVGRGVEGRAAFAYLKKHLPENIIEMVDQKDGKNYLDKQQDFDIAVKSPGVKSELLKIPYTTATNIFLSNAKGKVIGVTGTKGKSTTTTLIFKMLEKQGLDAYFGGNIGNSPLDFLDKLNEHAWTVLEMSSFQLKDLKISPARNASASVAGGPHIAVILMISEEHLDYHQTLADYIFAKRNILRFQKKDDFAVINRDYLPSNESDIYTKGEIFNVSRERECDKGCYVKDGYIWLSQGDKKERIIKTEEIKLLGKHNLENVCAATMAAVLAGVAKKNIVQVLKNFQGLPHRLEFVKKVEGITFINDSLSTIPAATIRALETFPDTETLIAGGYDRGLDFTKLGKYLVNSNVKTLILFPPTGKKIWQAVCAATPEEKRPEKFDVSSMKQAVRIAFAKTSPGKTCLLSPASPSFGIFKDYKDRGEQFKKEVGRLSEI